LASHKFVFTTLESAAFIKLTIAPVTSPPAFILPVIVDCWANKCKEIKRVIDVKMNFMLFFELMQKQETSCSGK
jgi:hypothetical protein